MKKIASFQRKFDCLVFDDVVVVVDESGVDDDDDEEVVGVVPFEWLFGWDL